MLDLRESSDKIGMVGLEQAAAALDEHGEPHGPVDVAAVREEALHTY